MRGPVTAIAGAMLVSTLALAGCSSSGSSSSSSSSSSINIPFKSPALVGGSLPALYTCDGKDISPPLEWGAVPSAIKDLAVFILGLTPDPTTHNDTISIEWAVVGIDPALHRLPAGRLPPGVLVGRASDGKTHYSICPAKGQTKSYQFAVYGVPVSVGIPPRFSGLELLQGINDPNSATAALVGGNFRASYTRRSNNVAHR